MRFRIFQMVRRDLVGLCILVWALCPSPMCVAQEAHSNSDSAVSLQNQIDRLEKGQGQILDELNTLSKELETKLLPSSDAPPASIKIQGEPFTGELSAPIAIIEFADFECPFCGQFARDTYPQVLANYVKTGKAVFFYHDFPLSAHPHAALAAEAARCAAEQGQYWQMHDDLFAHQSQLSERTISTDAQSLGIDSGRLMDCISTGRYTAAVKKSAQDAQQMGVRATPSFFIGTIDSGGELKIIRALRGAYSYEAFKSALDGVLAQAESDQHVSAKPDLVQEPTAHANTKP